MNPVSVGILLNSALYLALVVITGLMTNHGLAWKCGIVAIGVTHLAYSQQGTSGSTTLAKILVWISILTGAAAGLLLLWP